ncbi:MAG: hypothetical protein U0470_03845 [Anaerolineae bacterium]
MLTTSNLPSETIVSFTTTLPASLGPRFSTSSVYVSSPLWRICPSGLPNFVIRRSEMPRIGTRVVAVLFAGTGSLCAAEATALFVASWNAALAATLNVTWYVFEAPAAIVPRLHVICDGPLGLQLSVSQL